MPGLPAGRVAARLTVIERLVAGLAGAGLLAVALALAVEPLSGASLFPNAPMQQRGASGHVDSDLTTLSAVLANGAVAAIIIAQ